jgi:hypothetical protein
MIVRRGEAEADAILRRQATTSISIGGGTSGTAPLGPDARHTSRIERRASSRPLKVCPDGASEYDSWSVPLSVTSSSGTDARPAMASVVPRGSRSGSPMDSAAAGRAR